MLADRGLRLLGQQQAPQPAGRIGKRGRDGVVSIQPDGALRGVRRMAATIALGLPPARRGKTLLRRVTLRPRSGIVPRGARLELSARGVALRVAARRVRLAATRPVKSGALMAWRIMAGLLPVAWASRGAAVATSRFASRPLPGRTGRLASGSTIWTAIGWGARRAAWAVTMGRFHYCPYSAR